MLAWYLLQGGTGSRPVKGKEQTFKYGTCGMRGGTKFAKRTAGALWAMSDDGYLFPPVEMPDAESKRMTLLCIINWFKGRQIPTGDYGKCVLVYDDMCHLLR